MWIRDRLKRMIEIVASRRSWALGVFLSLILLSGACARKPVVQTVTVNPSQHPNAAGTPEVSNSLLAPRDLDIEKAGDQIAAATLHLRERRAGLALHAIEQAEADIKRAVEKRERNGTANGELRPTLAELQAARNTVHRGNLDDAVMQLRRINKKLDSIE